MDMPTHPTRSSHAGHQHGPEHDHDHKEHSAPGSANEALRDPVCGMTVTTDSPHKAEHAGRPYWFCSTGCRTKFLAEPLKYLSPVASPAAPTAAAGTIYTCPMHPEIR